MKKPFSESCLSTGKYIPFYYAKFEVEKGS